MKHLTLAFLALAATSVPAFAGEAPTHVVELFTSQGCSSCPPANKFVGKLAEEPGVLALTYGVTYWDYLGWKDTFGDPKFTARQREYRDGLEAANIYTPQIVLNGSAHSPRYSRKDVLSMPLAPNSYTADLRREGRQLILQSNAPADQKIVLIAYTPGTQDVAVKRGENGGRTLSLTNVVTDVIPVTWRGGTASIPAPEGFAYAALIHAPETAKLVGAAILPSE